MPGEMLSIDLVNAAGNAASIAGGPVTVANNNLDVQ